MSPDEILGQRGEVPNFASFLRVTCMRYIRRRLMAALPATKSTAIPPKLAAVRSVPKPANGTIGLPCRRSHFHHFSTPHMP